MSRAQFAQLLARYRGRVLAGQLADVLERIGSDYASHRIITDDAWRGECARALREAEGS